MSNVFSTFAEYLSFPFVQYAFVAGVLVALCSSLLGVTLLLKRFSFIGDGLSHVAFGAMAVAAVMSISNEMLIIMPVTIVCAIFLLKRNQNSQVRGDASLAMFSVGAMAIGYLILNVFSTSANIAGDVCSTLFGSTSILTLQEGDIIICVAMSVIVIVSFVLLYNKLFAITFDETFAKATGINTEFYNTVVAVITAIIVVLAMKLVGALLTSALIVFPALTSMRLYGSFKKVTICSAIVAVVAALVGISFSILFSTPVGATVVFVNILIFLIFTLIGKFKN